MNQGDTMTWKIFITIIIAVSISIISITSIISDVLFIKTLDFYCIWYLLSSLLLT